MLLILTPNQFCPLQTPSVLLLLPLQGRGSRGTIPLFRGEEEGTRTALSFWPLSAPSSLPWKKLLRGELCPLPAAAWSGCSAAKLAPSALQLGPCRRTLCGLTLPGFPGGLRPPQKPSHSTTCCSKAPATGPRRLPPPYFKRGSSHLYY